MSACAPGCVECIACDCVYAPRLLMSQSVSISFRAVAGRCWRDGGGTLLPLSGCQARGSLTPLQQSSASATLVFTALLLGVIVTNFWRSKTKQKTKNCVFFRTLQETKSLYLSKMPHGKKKKIIPSLSHSGLLFLRTLFFTATVAA